jgi:hypothetical protein
MRHIVSQLVPCTTIIIPSVSIIADALEAVRPHRATATIQRNGSSIATACKTLPVSNCRRGASSTFPLQIQSLPIVTCDLEQSP